MKRECIIVFQVEPAVLDAQQAVKSIRKQHLVEIRSMANPPALVKLALESICLLLGESASDWKVSPLPQIKFPLHLRRSVNSLVEATL